MQNITGNVNDDILHNKALLRMVKMRGGLKGLGWGGSLAVLLSMYDISHQGLSLKNSS